MQGQSKIIIFYSIFSQPLHRLNKKKIILSRNIMGGYERKSQTKQKLKVKKRTQREKAGNEGYVLNLRQRY